MSHKELSGPTGGAKADPGLVVRTTVGKVRGLRQGNVHIFKGVPYGASTADNRRFMPPEDAEPWTGVRDTFELGPRALQLDFQFHGQVPPEFEGMDPGGPMSEDCLCLNVWTPGLESAAKRPVMVWLHGGGYTTGSGGFICYQGTELARKHDVVVVTINHRLNIFGFLYLAESGDERYARASNVGMLDIVKALAWVRDNIASFGGNPGNVTIFGQSGGGGKVRTLMAMPAAKGLFHRAVIQSGAQMTGVPHEVAVKSAEAVLAKLQIKHAAELQKLPTDRLLAAAAALTGNGMPGSGSIVVAPVIDGHTIPSNAFTTGASELSGNVPLLIGSTETEAAFLPNQPLDPIDGAELSARVKQFLRRADDAAINQLIDAYRKGRPSASNTDLYLILASDVIFGQSAAAEAERRAEHGQAPVYQYLFAWRSPVRDGKLRSFHTLEIPFVFDNVDAARSMTGSGRDRYALATKMSSAWVAFARSGNPNHVGLPDWPAFDKKRRAAMIFDDECKAVNDPYREEQRMLRALLNPPQTRA